MGWKMPVVQQRQMRLLFRSVLYMLITKSHQCMVVFMRVNSFSVKGPNSEPTSTSVDFTGVNPLDLYLPESGQESVKAAALVNILLNSKSKCTS